MVISGATTVQAGAAETDSGQTSQSQQSQTLEDENQSKPEEITIVEEDGSVKEAEDVDGSMEEEAVTPPALKAKARAATSSNLYVVNFNIEKKEGETTSYTEVSTGNAGYTNGQYGADAAYLGKSGNKVKFMMSGVIGLVDADDVEVVPYSSAKVVSGYEVDNGRLMHGIVRTIKTPGYNTRLDNGAAPSYLKSGVKYYSYDGHYFYTSYATMISDYQSNTRKNSVNPNNPYYNYYQYLPMRSTTSYSASTLNSMISSNTSSGSKMRNTGSTLVSSQNTYGVNALIMTGIAANESAWGTSSICKSKNNLFGLNAVDSSPGTSASTFASVSVCIKDFANGWMSRQYLNPTNWKYSGGFLGNKGSGLNVRYASDPFWGEKAAHIAYKLDLSQGSKDYNKYTIAIKNTVASDHDMVNIRKEATTSSTVLYKSGNEANYAVLALSTTPTNSFYKIQSDGVLNSGRTALSSSGAYSFSNMYAYMSSDYLTIVNRGSTTPVEEPEPATLSSIAITKAPSKTVYTEGETFSATGMTVTATWSDGSKTDVTKDVKYTSSALTTADKSVSISYTSGGVTKTASQSITVKEKAVVTGIKISPTEISLEQGASKTFGSAVSGTGDFSRDVKWSVSGNESEETSIDENGKLTVGADEKAGAALTVTVTSAADASKSASAKATVIAKPVIEEEKETVLEYEDEDLGASISLSFGEAASGADDIALTVESITEGTTDSESGLTYDYLIEPALENNMKVLGVYDISLSDEVEGQITLSFDIGTMYDGMKAMVLHYYDDEGTTYTEVCGSSSEDAAGEADLTVVDGKITVTVDHLSPFVVALEDPDAETPEEEGDGIVSDGSDSTDSTDSTVSGTGSDNNDVSSSETTGDTVTGGDDESQAEPSDPDDGKTAPSDGKDGGKDNSDPAAGDSASGDQNTDQPDGSAQTGDEFALSLWIVLATMAALGVTAVLLTRKTGKSH